MCARCPTSPSSIPGDSLCFILKSMRLTIVPGIVGIISMANIAGFALLLACSGSVQAEDTPATLAIGAAAPDFNLPAVGGKTYRLQDFASSKVLVLVFTCVHCPTAQLYEGRIKKLADDYRDSDVVRVAIQPNNPNAVRLDELGYTDLADSLPEMKIRAEYRHFNFPFLYDGDTQQVTQAYGAQATPHIFIFDKERKLR